MPVAFVVWTIDILALVGTCVTAAVFFVAAVIAVLQIRSENRATDARRRKLSGRE